jgi:hypothetical protein
MSRRTSALSVALIVSLASAYCAKKAPPTSLAAPTPQAVAPPVVAVPAPVVLRPIHVAKLAGPRSLYPPNRRATPGALDPRITQATIHDTICQPAYLDTVRPSIAYTDPIKDKMLADHHLPGGVQHYELDHFIPVELGGHPTSTRNLWMEPYGDATHPLRSSDKWPADGSILAGANQKDEVETTLNKHVCEGTITLKNAQDKIRTDWYAIYKELHSKEN